MTDMATAILEVESPYNPDLTVATIPSDLLTASGSGLDPDISEAAALMQVPRIAAGTGPFRRCRPAARRGQRSGS